MVRSDNGPEFTAAIAQGIPKPLNIDWNLHCAYHPQSSGQVDRMNWALKCTPSKFAPESSAGWPMLLPIALLQTQCSPFKVRKKTFTF